MLIGIGHFYIFSELSTQDLPIFKIRLFIVLSCNRSYVSLIQVLYIKYMSLQVLFCSPWLFFLSIMMSFEVQKFLILMKAS